MSEPKEGLLTFRAEGNNFRGNQYYSRVIHWPGNVLKCRKEGSGVTIGRGYDIKHRSRGRVIHDLNYAGIPAEKFSRSRQVQVSATARRVILLKRTNH